MTPLPVASPVRVAPRPDWLACVGPCPPPTSTPRRGRASTPIASVADRCRLTISDVHARAWRRPDEEPCTT